VDLGEAAPKRHKPGPAERARLRAERAAAAGEPAPARPRPVSGGRRPRLEVQTGAMLMQVNLGFMMACAMVQQAGGPLDPRTDPLQPNEIVLLARGIALQADQHATFRKYLSYMLTVSGSVGLISVLGAIVVVRASQHGIIPPEAGQQAALALMADPRDVQSMVEQMQTPVPADDEEAA